MPDLSHYFGGDLSTGPSGDIATVTGSTETQQRIVRRLATNTGAYIWQLPYGAGLPAMIGNPVSESQIRGIVVEQMAMEAGVDQTQPVGVKTTGTNLGSIGVTISYTDAASGQATTLTLPA
jgi:hypothetical protein